MDRRRMISSPSFPTSHHSPPPLTHPAVRSGSFFSYTMLSTRMSHQKSMMFPSLFIPSTSRFVIFRPDRDEDLWSYYKTHQSTYWQAEEIDFSQDVIDFRSRLNDDEREYIKCTLAFFAASDGIVAENLSKHMTRLVKLPEARFFYDFQTMIENVRRDVPTCDTNAGGKHRGSRGTLQCD